MKAALQITLEELPEEHINKTVANFKRLTAYMAVAASGGLVSSSICSKSVHLQVCISPTSRLYRLFSEPSTDSGEDWRLLDVF